MCFLLNSSVDEVKINKHIKSLSMQLSEHIFSCLFGRFHFQFLMTFNSRSLSLKALSLSRSEQKPLPNEWNIMVYRDCFFLLYRRFLQAAQTLFCLLHIRFSGLHDTGGGLCDAHLVAHLSSVRLTSLAWLTQREHKQSHTMKQLNSESQILLSPWTRGNTSVLAWCLHCTAH